MTFSSLFLFILRTEEDSKGYSYHERITGKDEPAGFPVTHQVAIICPVAVMVDDHTCENGSDRCSQTVGHQHEQTLSRCSYLHITFLVYKQTTRHIEEVEGYTVNDA